MSYSNADINCALDNPNVVARRNKLSIQFLKGECHLMIRMSDDSCADAGSVDSSDGCSLDTESDVELSDVEIWNGDAGDDSSEPKLPQQLGLGAEIMEQNQGLDTVMGETSQPDPNLSQQHTLHGKIKQIITHFI